MSRRPNVEKASILCNNLRKKIGVIDPVQKSHDELDDSDDDTALGDVRRDAALPLIHKHSLCSVKSLGLFGANSLGATPLSTFSFNVSPQAYPGIFPLF
jgi:hypothetical protein